MNYSPTNWQDRIVEKPLTYTMVNNGDGTVTLTPAPGSITQAGTPVNATNLNKIEQGVSAVTRKSVGAIIYAHSKWGGF